jgi:N-acetylglucosamine kinase-like BadF-type ATPase
VALFLGIDGGGTKTHCIAGDEHTVLGVGSAGASKVLRVGEAEAGKALHAAIQQACESAQVQPSDVASAVVGIAGASRIEVSETVHRLVAEIVGGEIRVVGDMAIAHESAFRGGPGVIVIAGTGSIAYGRNERGETARAGGWGSLVSDEGSGDWIGRAAVAATLRAYDSGATTLLNSVVMNTWHLATRDDIARLASAERPPDFAALVPQVLSVADAGDIVARDILIRAGAELAELARIVLRRLWPQPQAAVVGMTGGVFANSFLVQQIFQNTVRAERPAVTVRFTAVDPVMGALTMARRMVMKRKGKGKQSAQGAAP